MLFSAAIEKFFEEFEQNNKDAVLREFAARFDRDPSATQNPVASPNFVIKASFDADTNSFKLEPDLEKLVDEGLDTEFSPLKAANTVSQYEHMAEMLKPEPGAAAPASKWSNDAIVRPGFSNVAFDFSDYSKAMRVPRVRGRRGRRRRRRVRGRRR